MWRRLGRGSISAISEAEVARLTAKNTADIRATLEFFLIILIWRSLWDAGVDYRPPGGR